MKNPEYFEEEYQKFKKELPKKDKIESSFDEELNEKEIVDKEKSMFSKFQGKAKSIARFMILLTSLTLTSKPEATHKDTFQEKPKVTITEKKPDYKNDKEYQYFYKCLDEDYTEILRHIKTVNDYPWAKEIVSDLTEAHPAYVLEHLNAIIDEPWAQEIIENAFEMSHDHRSIHDQGYYLCQKTWGIDLYVKSIKENPHYFNRGLFDDRLLPQLEKVDDPEFKIMLDIVRSNYKHRHKLMMLTSDINQNKITMEEAKRISSDSVTFLNYIASNPENLEKKATQKETKNISQNLIHEINYLHNLDDSVRFKSLKNLKSESVFLLMVSGQAELYTSSYNGTFDRLLEKMDKENISGSELFKKMENHGTRTFIELASRYNRLNDFLETMPENERQNIIEDIVDNVQKEKDFLKEGAVLADIFGSIKDQNLNLVIKNKLKDNYLLVQKINDSKGENLYGLLASTWEGKNDSEDQWFQEIREKYIVPTCEEITTRELFGKDGKCVEQYFFYNDDDGKVSYQDFINSYQNDSNWKIEDKGNFIKINSQKGSPVEIYANKPDQDESGQQSIKNELSKNNLHPEVIVHRGHSYHVDKTLPAIDSKTSLVFLGSCGGYGNIANILETSKEAQVVSTKGKGTGYINDPLLKMLNEEIIKGEDINWSSFWQKAEKKFKNNNDFENYMSPDKNQSLLFIKAYNELMKEKNE